MIIVRPWLFRLFRKPPNGMALFPFILLEKEAFRHNKVLIHHETIHLRQQLELLIVPFYVLYGLNYLVNLFVYRDHYRAYRNICFEREAYAHERNLNYLKKRYWFSAFKYIFNK